MDKTLKNWLQEISKNQLNSTDVERSLAYARDLEHGLRLIRTYPQGVTIFGSARLSEHHPDYRKARELGRLLANNGHTVITGGGPGIMEAANRGAYEYGGRSVGLNITLPHEQHVNPYLTDSYEFRYFFARKVMLAMSSKVYVLFPGGFGTMDEFTEILTLMQDFKMPKMPIFLIGKTFWRPLDKFFRNRQLSRHLIDKDDLKIYNITDDINRVVKAANEIGHLKISDNLYDNYKSAKL